MHGSAFALLCLAVAEHDHTVQPTDERPPDIPCEKHEACTKEEQEVYAGVSKRSPVLATLLLGLKPTAAWHVTGQGHGFNLAGCHPTGKYARRCWVHRGAERVRGSVAMEQRFFATCVKGMEPVLAAELAGPHIRASDVSEGSLGVHFMGSAAVAARAVMWSRTALRIMHLLALEENVVTPDDLYAFTRDVISCSGGLFDNKKQTMSVQAVISLQRCMEKRKAKRGDWQCFQCGKICFGSTQKCLKCGAERPSDKAMVQSHYTSLTVKDAICDQLRDDRGWRPSIDLDDPDVPLHLYLHRGEAQLYRVCSGAASLHKRGYRTGSAIHKAALRETLAAGMLLHAGYDPDLDVLCDPMTGSGTIAIEGALIATNTAPGLFRTAPPAMARWNDDMLGDGAAAWQAALAEARDLRLPRAPQPIFANDIHEGALKLARRAALAARVDNSIIFSQEDAKSYEPPERPSLVATNPPWDSRLVGGKEAWVDLSDFLKGQCGGARAWVLSGNAELTRYLCMKAFSKRQIKNAGVELALLGYEVLQPKPGGRPLPDRETRLAKFGAASDKKMAVRSDETDSDEYEVGIRYEEEDEGEYEEDDDDDFEIEDILPREEELGELQVEEELVMQDKAMDAEEDVMAEEKRMPQDEGESFEEVEEEPMWNMKNQKVAAQYETTEEEEQARKRKPQLLVISPGQQDKREIKVADVTGADADEMDGLFAGLYSD